jgi:hypothetical protein
MSHKPKSRPIEKYLSKENLVYESSTGSFYFRLKDNSLKRAGWIDQHGYRLIRLYGVLLREHHLVWLFETGSWPEFELDHEDGDPSNNKFSNLRPANRRGQGANQSVQKRREGFYKGVYKVGNRYNAKIKHRGKSRHLGMYDTPEEAALRYNEAARFYFGNWAKLNEVTLDDH